MTILRRQRTAAAKHPPSKLERSSTWAGVKKGDPVEVAGTRLRSATWQFVARVTNTTTGEEWIEVVGGANGDRKTRSFQPERIFALGTKGIRGASLADAPKLPFV